MMPGASLNRERAAPFRDDRHYFHQRTAVGMWKVRLALLALMLTAGWLAARMIGPTHPYSAVTHGELVQAHAAIGDRCEACHVPFEGGQNAGLFAAHERWHNFRCEGCHAGPSSDPRNYRPHYDRASNPRAPADLGDCSNCHHDHQGADLGLTRVPDSECVRCHRNATPRHPAVTSFPTNHPPFRATATAPARGLKFNHTLHLVAGLTEAGNLGNPSAAFSLRQVDSANRDQYRRFTDATGIVHLDCTACHEPAGGGYNPVRFDAHCQGCHAQNVFGLQGPAGVTTKPFIVPHGRPVAEVDRFIRSELIRQIDEQKSLLRKVPLPPNDRLDAPRTPVPSDLGREADALSKMAGGLLSCRKCHTMEGDRVKPTNTPALWLPAARFDHTTHRAVRCAECHRMWGEQAVVRGAGPESLNVPGVDTCRDCHAPLRQRSGSAFGGARYDCVSCHRYHHP
jgi:hypothetical protein